MSQAADMNRYSSYKIFSVVFSVLYAGVVYSTWSPFRYYPIPSQFTLGPLPPDAGPAILWYGWVIASLVFSAVVALIVPRGLAGRLWDGFTWLIPAIVVAAIIVYETRLL